MKPSDFSKPTVRPDMDPDTAGVGPWAGAFCAAACLQVMRSAAPAMGTMIRCLVFDFQCMLGWAEVGSGWLRVSPHASPCASFDARDYANTAAQEMVRFSHCDSLPGLGFPSGARSFSRPAIPSTSTRMRQFRQLLLASVVVTSA